MKNAIRILCAALCAILLLASVGMAEGDAKAAETMRLQILASSDVHGRFLSYDYALNADANGSFAQIATAINELRDAHTIVVDCGDYLQGNSVELFTDDDLHPMMCAMNEIGYDVIATGNHEYNFGMDTLKRVLAQSKATVLCGNVWDKEGAPVGDAYTILDVDGVKVGMIGMVTPNITHWDSLNLEGCTVTDPVAETQAIIKEIRNQVDVLIAVEHMDTENELEVPNSGIRDLANACPELDAIIAGHGHNRIDDLQINGVPIIENKSNGTTLGQLLMDLEKTEDGWKITNVTTAVLDMADYEADARLTQLLEPYHLRAVEDAEQVIGSFDSDYLVEPNVEGQLPNAMQRDTALLDLISNVELYYSNAKVSAINVMNSKANIYRGDIRKCDVSLIYKYVNALYSLRMNGAQLKKWMEWSAGYFKTTTDASDKLEPALEDNGYYNYHVFTGVNYEIDLSRESGSRVVSLTWPDGTPVKDEDVFEVAVHNYAAATNLLQYGTVFDEGDPLPELVEMDIHGEIGGLRELITDYIKNVKGGVLTAECDHNWHFTGRE